jgi:hypothetical protein
MSRVCFVVHCYQIVAEVAAAAAATAAGRNNRGSVSSTGKQQWQLQHVAICVA